MTENYRIHDSAVILKVQTDLYWVLVVGRRAKILEFDGLAAKILKTIDGGSRFTGVPSATLERGLKKLVQQKVLTHKK